MKSAIVALSQLTFDTAHNSRQLLDEQAQQELTRSIEANGLITPLTVRATGSGSYAVIDGHRRLEALNRLYGEKADDHVVPVLVRDADDKDAVVLSLAANIVRLPLHPADQYQAFAKMLDEGMEREEIAARFNLSLKDVERVLALGRVIPAALDLYRQGRIDADTVKLFASCSEERQLAVWNKAYENDQLTRWQVHRLLSDDTIMGNSTIARIVGEEAYEAAGGRIERSLFNDDTRWLDTELAKTMADTAFTARIEELKTEGWAFVQRDEDMPKQWRSWGREYAEADFAPEDWEELKAIDARLDALSELDQDEWTEEQEAEYEELENRQGEIRQERVIHRFTPEQKAATGVVICEDYTLVYGVRKPEKVQLPEPGAEPEPKKPEVKPWSQALIDEVESYGTVAAQLAIMREPNVADCMLLAGMYQDTVHDPAVRVMALNSADRFCDTQINAGAEIQKELKSFKIKGAKFWSVFEQIRHLSLPDRERLRAVLVARAMKKRRGSELEEVFANLTTADVMATWKPEKEFFERLNTKQLEEIYKELTGYGFNDPTTKASAVAMVATKAAAANWLPKVLRKGASAVDQVKAEHAEAKSQKKAKTKRDPKAVTKVGEDGKTERKKAA